MDPLYIDTATVLIYLFWFFFAGLLIYIRREDKREGYPLDSSGREGLTVQGFPRVPTPRASRAKHPALEGTDEPLHDSPKVDSSPELAARPYDNSAGSMLIPTGDPMADGLGAAAWNPDRADRCDLTIHGDPKIQPMSILNGYVIDRRDPDPHGLPVYGGDGALAGTVSDVWVDRSEPQVRYYTVDLEGGGAPVLLPAGFAKVNRFTNRIDVKALFAKHFARVPSIAADDRITLLEEDRIVAYYAGGTQFADPARSEPLL